MATLSVKEDIMVAKEILEQVGQVDPERLLKAVQGLASGTYQVTITRQDKWRVSGTVANGKAYDVSVGVDGFFACSCADFVYRQAICKHAVMLTMVATQEHQEQPQEGEHRPRLKLARVSPHFYS